MTSSTIRFGRDVCADPDRALKLEWLETNGLGGYASSTIAGLNTRRYHGLLTAATEPPAGRFLLLSKLEETVTIGHRRYDLSANQYPGVIHPRGYQYLAGFRLDPFPVFSYEIEGLRIEKRVFMVHGENTTVIQYSFCAPAPIAGQAPTDAWLELRPLIAFRQDHGTTHENGSLNPDVQAVDGMASVTPYEGLPTLFLAHADGALQRTGYWYRNFEYSVERERGLDFEEDLFNPFLLRFPLSGERPIAIIASTVPHSAADAEQQREREIARRTAIVLDAPSQQPLVRSLTAAADAFIVERGEFKTVIAGYHWFSDWGRDTMIALPGLTLVTGRYEIARSVLQAFADLTDQGMLPNRFPDAGQSPEYNTADATLWFFEAVRSYVDYTGDYAFVRERLYRTLKDIVSWHLKGTRYGIRVDADGLLRCGAPGVQLTWMDAKLGDWVVTPRSGKPVEIQALWYNALRIMEDFAARFDEPEQAIFLRELAALAHESFNAKFWNEEARCLYDCVDGLDADGSIRPNQVFACSLRHTLLSQDRALQVVSIVERDLVTPLGLRSLSPSDSRYRGTYGGGVRERDSAYHQGTVWPWLLGPFVTAYTRVHGSTLDVRNRAAGFFEAFNDHLSTAGLGHVSEVASADFPYEPGGCMAQAWSVAELLRAAVEDVYQVDASRSG